MSAPDKLVTIIHRIANGIYTDADLQALREMLGGVAAAGPGSVAIRGNVNGATIVTGNDNTILKITFQADGLSIDDRPYGGQGAVTLQSLLQEILSLKINWYKVSQKLLEERLQLTTNPMTGGHGISYQVEQVHVPLGLLERKKIPKRKEDVLPERGSDLYISDEERYPDCRDGERSRQEPDYKETEEVEITKRFEHGQFLEQVLRQGDSPKSKGKRIAIIGEPGAGKTTLLQLIARWVTETVPKSVVIWISLADLQKHDVESYLKEQWLQAVVRRTGEEAEVSKAAERNFSALFKQKRVWLLLDGLDEMPSHNPLDEVNRQISEGGWLQQARIVMTCRLNLWDSNRNALHDLNFDTYRTLDFSYPEQVEQFIGQWFTLQERSAVRLREGLCTALKAPGKDRIRDLVKNPLRLTLLCFSWNVQQGHLPETQAELYEQFTEDFYNWKQRQFPTRAVQRRQLNAALGELAREAIDKETTRFRLRQDFVMQFLGEDEEEPGSLIQMALKLGWLNRVGFDAENPRKKVYAFFHPTFEEYFAALAIDDHRFFLNHFPSNPNSSRASYRVFEPWWKQVFLLWLGRKDENLKQQKESLIAALFTFRDGCKGVYRDRAFFLTAEGIAEFKDCMLAHEIVAQILLWAGFPTNLRQIFRLISDWSKDKVRKERARAIFDSTDLEKVNKQLEQYLEITRVSVDYEEATEILSKISSNNQAIIQMLTDRLKTAKSKYDRNNIAKSLGKVDPGNEAAVEEIIRPLRTARNKFKITQNKFKCDQAARALGKIGAGNETAVRALVHLLETTRDEFYRSSIIGSLGKIGVGNETAVHALVHLLETTPRDYFSYICSPRIEAIKTLGEIGIGSEIAIQTLMRLLETVQEEDDYGDNNEQESAAENLGKIGVDSEIALRTLIHFLKIVKTSAHKRSNLGKSGAIEGIRRIATKNREMVIHALLPELEAAKDLPEVISFEDRASSRRVEYLVDVIFLVGELSIGNEADIQLLLQLLKVTKHSYIHQSALNSLCKIGIDNELLIQEFLRLLEKPQDRPYLAVQDIAKSIGKVAPGNEEAIKILTKRLEKAQNDFRSRLATKNLNENDYSQIQFSNNIFYLQQAAECLGSVDLGNKKAIQVHFYLLEHTQDITSVQRIAEGLHEIDPGNSIAIQALAQALMRLVEILQSDDAYRNSRFEAIMNQAGCDAGCRIFTRKLGEIGLGNETAIQALTRLIETTQNTDTRHKAIENLGKIGLGNETAIQALIHLAETTQDEYDRADAIDALGEIGVGNETVFQVLLRLLENTLDTGSDHSLTSEPYRILESLKKVGAENEIAIRGLIHLLETTQNKSYRDRNRHRELEDRHFVIETLEKISASNEAALLALVRALPKHLRNEWSYRLMFKCAETLPYPKFYQAFHSSR